MSEAAEDMTAQDERAKKRAMHMSLGIIFLTLFIDLIGFSILFPLFAAMMEHYQGQEWGLMAWLVAQLPEVESPMQQAALFGGLIMAFYAVLQALFSPLWGALSDKIGRRKVLMITTLGNFLGYFLWIFANSFVLLLIARGLNGLMAGNVSVASAAVADVTDAQHRTMGMAYIGMAFGFGFIFGPAIGGFTYALFALEADPTAGAFALNPFSVPAAFAAVMAVINLWFLRKYFKETKPQKQAVETNSDEEMQEDEVGNEVIEEKEPRGFTLRWSRIAPGVGKTCWAQCLFTICFAMMEATLVFLAAQFLDYGPGEMAWVFVIMGLVSALVQGGLVRRLSGKVSPQQFALMGISVLILTFLGLAFLVPGASSGFWLFALSALLGLGIGLAMPGMNSMASLFASAHEQGVAMGAFRSAGAVGRAIGPLLGAIMYFSWSPVSPYFGSALCLLIPLGLILLLPKPKAN